MTPNQNSWLIMNLDAFIQTNDFITVGKSPIAASYTLKYRGLQIILQPKLLIYRYVIYMLHSPYIIDGQGRQYRTAGAVRTRSSVNSCTLHPVACEWYITWNIYFKQNGLDFEGNLDIRFIVNCSFRFLVWTWNNLWIRMLEFQS